MNKRHISFLLLLLAMLSSCEKDKTYGEETVTYESFNTDITGTKWILESGIVYLENLDDDSKIYYDHFSSTKQISNLDIFEGSAIAIDHVVKGSTSWYFQNGIFTLNDTTTFQYSDFNARYGSYQMFGLENGSARPIEMVKGSENSFSCKIHEAWQSNGVTNYSYVTVLTFVKEGTICDGCGPRINRAFDYAGVVFSPNSSSNTSDLGGSRWVITRYDEGSFPYYPNDTIEFISNKLYSTNGGLDKDYTLNSTLGTNSNNLTLYYSSTFGGSFSGKVNATFISDGEISNAVFTHIFDESNTIKAWMKTL